jgi:hypothetical protein
MRAALASGPQFRWKLWKEKMNRKILISIIISILTITFAARAEQGGMGHYVPGTYLDFCGVPPAEPGLYAGNYFINYANGKFGGNKQLPLGGEFAVGVTANVHADAPFTVYAYPWQLGNFTFSSGIYPNWIWENVRVSASYDRNHIQLSGQTEQSVNGFGDMEISPIMTSWTNGDFTLGGMFNTWAPSGNFNAGQLVNPGMGYWTFEPMLAFSWLSKKIGTEFTIFPAFDFNSENHHSDYQSGALFHVDATLAQHLPLFDGIIGAGVSTSYINQITGDSGSGAKLGSFEMQSVAVGPTVSYVHSLGKATLIADVSWLPQVSTRNTPMGNYTWFKLTIAF